MGQALSARPRATMSSRQAALLGVLASSWSWLFLLAMLAFFAVLGQNFLSIRNISTILVSSTLVMLMAIGQTYVIITAGIDLSIGWTVGLTSVVAARVMRDVTAEPAVAISLGIIVGLLVALIPGLINGVLIARVRIPPFITTLGMFGIIRGAAFLLTDGQNVVGNIPANVRESLRAVGNGSLLYYTPDIGFTWFSQPADITSETLRTVQRVLPYPVLIVAVIVLIFAFVLARTQFGRHTYAIGGNADAARRAGIRVNRNLVFIYMISALTAGFAGIMHVFRFTAGGPQVGDPALLDSVAAVVIGGTSLFGGEGRLSGTVVGALIIAVLDTGLVNLGVDALWKFIIVGMVIIVAVLFNQVQAYIQRQRAHT